MQKGGGRGRDRPGSMWNLSNPFSHKVAIKEELQGVLDGVSAIKNVCKISRSSILSLTVVETPDHTLFPPHQDLNGEETKSHYWKIVESITKTENEFKEVVICCLLC